MKKILSIVLIATLVLFSAISVCADDTSDEFEDVIRFGIMQGDENGDMNFEALTTRAEMAQIVVNAAGLSGVDAANIPTEGFSDVGENHWAYNAIMLAQSVGYINGNGDGTFAPDDNVTYGQMLKMAVTLLGYEPIAEQRGGYPEGYVAVAKQIGLTDGIQFKIDDYAVRYDVAAIMEKALNTPIMEQISYGSEAEYRISDGKDGGELVTLKNNLE